MDVYLRRLVTADVDETRKNFASHCDNQNHSNDLPCKKNTNKEDEHAFQTDLAQARVILIIWMIGLLSGLAIFAGELGFKSAMWRIRMMMKGTWKVETERVKQAWITAK